MKSDIAALFDLDRTLTRVRSLESAFLPYLVRKGAIGAPQFLAAAVFLLRYLPRDAGAAIQGNKQYLKGCRASEIEQLAEEFIGSAGDELLFPESSGLLWGHRDRQHVTILITGSLDLLVTPLVRRLRLPFDHVFSTRLKTTEGRFTGEIAGVHYRGEAKRSLALELSSTIGISLQQSYCYADSRSDLPLLSLFGHPVAVNPDRVLAREACRNAWQTLTFA